MTWGVTRVLRRSQGAVLAAVVLIASAVAPAVALAAAPTSTTSDAAPFSLQVSPSPLIVSVKPGEEKSFDLQIRNTGTASEDLVAALRTFKVDASGNVTVSDSETPEIAPWVTFSAPKFSIVAGELYTESVNFKLPADIGFSYTFAISITRATAPVSQPGKQALRGTVAVLGILSVDKPGASRSFDIVELRSAKRMYEYLPATLSITIKNTGNTAVQPTGNVFVNRSGASGDPISVLSVNQKGNYILPGSSRTLETSWQDGFPVYTSHKVADNAPEQQKLTWDWGKAQQFRFGKYTAKVVAIYNDGQRDVPITAEVSFWVVPWKLLIVLFIIFILVMTGIVVVVRRFIKIGRYVRPKRPHHHE